MIDGESYLGRVLIRPLSQSGDLTLYLWPLRCLKSQMGGPTFGIEVKGEEILRFDAHGPRGHWHKGGYDTLGAGGTHQDFPEGVVETPSQLGAVCARRAARAGPAGRTGDTVSASRPTAVAWPTADHATGAELCDSH